jgi:hypothetical protein
LSNVPPVTKSRIGSAASGRAAFEDKLGLPSRVGGMGPEKLSAPAGSRQWAARRARARGLTVPIPSPLD